MGRKAKDGVPIVTYELLRGLVIRKIGEAGNVWMRWKAIRAEVGRCESGCSDGLALLAANKLVMVRVDPNDRRKREVKLTPLGEKQFKLQSIGDELGPELDDDAEVE